MGFAFCLYTEVYSPTTPPLKKHPARARNLQEPPCIVPELEVDIQTDLSESNWVPTTL